MKWKLFKPNIKKLKEKRNINRLIKTLSDNDIELRRRAASALGEIGSEESVEPLIQLFADSDVKLHKKAVSALGEVVNRVGAENAIETICELIDYGKLKTLGFKKTFQENLLLDFQKICESCQKHSAHKYYVKKLRVFHLDDLVYNEEFGYIKCDNCGRTSKLFSSKEEIVDIIIEPKTINKINSIIQAEGLIKLPGHATFIDFIQLMEEIEQSGRDKNIIDVIRRIKSQVIDGERNRCFYCGKRVYSAMGKLCSVCNLIVCDEHILPETHGCKGTNIPPSGYAISRTGKVTSQEGLRVI
jgi:hypothetical protein